MPTARRQANAEILQLEADAAEGSTLDDRSTVSHAILHWAAKATSTL
jgi:hypothetical protein